ncbi:hypothetical protein FQZ97_607350 [compost metagenome]
MAWHYSKRTKNKVRRINAVLQHPDPELSWMLANIDREVIGADDQWVIRRVTGASAAPSAYRSCLALPAGVAAHARLMHLSRETPPLARKNPGPRARPTGRPAPPAQGHWSNQVVASLCLRCLFAGMS